MNSKTNSSHERILKLTQTALLAALIVVLQVFSSYIKVGPINLSFVLVPIVLGGFLVGPKAGAFLGGVFGLVVTIMCATGLDPSGFVIFSASPIMCVILCMLKGILAGFVPAVVYKAINKNNYHAVSPWLSSVLAPICNTGVFCIGMFVFYHDLLVSWAGGTNVIMFMMTGLVGINFLVEFCINLVLTPVITTIIQKLKKK